MNISHTIQSLSPHASDLRRRQLQSCFDYLLEKDNSVEDKNKEYFEFSLEERSLSEKGFEQIHSLDGRVEGSTEDGLVRYTRTQIVPDDDTPAQHWTVVYTKDLIVCERWNGIEDGERFDCRREKISRLPNIPSEVEQWKIRRA